MLDHQVEMYVGRDQCSARSLYEGCGYSLVFPGFTAFLFWFGGVYVTGGATLERPLVVVGYTTDDVCLACLAGGRNSVKVKKKLLYAKERKFIRAEARPSKPSV